MDLYPFLSVSSSHCNVYPPPTCSLLGYSADRNIRPRLPRHEDKSLLFPKFEPDFDRVLLLHQVMTQVTAENEDTPQPILVVGIQEPL